MGFWGLLLASLGDVVRFLLAVGIGSLKVVFLTILPSQIPLLAFLGLAVLGRSSLRRRAFLLALLAGVILFLVFVGFFHAGRIYLEYGPVLGLGWLLFDDPGSWGATVGLLFLLAVVGVAVDMILYTSFEPRFY